MNLHVVLPNDIDDPATPSGGNFYDRRVLDGLAATGWSVHEHAVYGAWPEPSGPDRAALAEVLAALPDGVLVLVDGLVASAVPEVLAAQMHRLRLVILVHMPLGGATERAALATARALVATSRWTGDRLYGLPAHVAPPGVDPAGVAPGSAAAAELLCVAAVTPHKGYDVLAEALAKVSDVPWTCVCVGSLTRDPQFVARLRRQLDEAGIADRVQLPGALTGAALDAAYAAADLLVLASRGETYGMVVTEALARGIPVLATDVGGIGESLGRAPDGSRPGLLVPADDPAALAGAVRRWLTDGTLRDALRRSARARRTTLAGWDATVAAVAAALTEAAG
jgi:Glycosyl transferases group 1